jgi:hypothetical protein
MTYEDAIQAVQDGSYRSASDADLREMLRACMDAGESALSKIHYIEQAADNIRDELAARRAIRLAKPHWSVIPIFWFSGVAALGGLVAIVDFVLRMFRRR